MSNFLIYNKKLIFSGLLLVGVLLAGVSFVSAQLVTAPENFSVTSDSACRLTLEWEGEYLEYGIEAIFISEEGQPIVGTEVDPPASGNVSEDGSVKRYVVIDGHGNNSLWEDAPEQFKMVDPGTKRDYRIQSIDRDLGERSSNWTDWKSGTSMSLPSKPEKPSGVDVTALESGNVEIKWNKVTNISDFFEEYGAFEIWASSSNDGGQNYSEAVKLDRYPADNPQMEGGKYVYGYNPARENSKDLTYKYTLRTQEVGGPSCDFKREEHVVFSDMSSPITIPVRPGGLSAEFVDSSDDIEIKLTWSDRQNSPNETRIDIQRSRSSNFNTVRDYMVGADTTSFNDENILEEDTYYYRIRSCISNTCSFWSDPVSITSGIKSLDNFSAVATYADTESADVSLTWQEDGNPIGGTNLKIERAGSDGTFSEIASLGAFDSNRQNRSYQDNNISLGETYTYRARIEDNGSYSAYTEESSVDLNVAYVLSGAAWSASDSPEVNPGPAGAGWISLNSNNTGSGPNYSVFISKGDGEIGRVQGVGWSDHFGWLSFHNVSMNLEGPDAGEMSGWAKFTLADESNHYPTWDGKVSLSGTVDDGSSYGVKLDFNEASGGSVPMEGQAWGGPMIGWIDFGSAYCSDLCDSKALGLGGSPVIVTPGQGHSISVSNTHKHGGAMALDPDGDLESYNWEFSSCSSNDIDPSSIKCPTLQLKSGSISGGSNESVNVPGPSYTPKEEGVYILKLTVKDSSGGSARALVNDQAVGSKPEISAGKAHIITTREVHNHTDPKTENRAWAKDENGDLDRYEWSMDSCFYYNGSLARCPDLNNDKGNFGNISAGEKAKINGPSYEASKGIRVFNLRLKVYDSAGNMTEDTITEYSTECSDGLDNDEDGLVDSEDPDCQSDEDDSEAVRGFDEFDFIFDEN